MQARIVQRMRPIVFLRILSLLISILLFAAFTRNREITYRIILPDKYVGWVRVDFAVKTPSALDSKNAVTIKVGEDGVYRTSAIMVYSAPTKYEFFYTTAQGLYPVREDYVDHG